MLWLGIAFAVVVVVPVSMIIFGVGTPPPPLQSVVETATEVARRKMPPPSHFVARDGTSLAYRAYPASGNRVAILVHGSSGSSRNMHALAEALQLHGISAYALDIRGHGESGPLGDIRYVGQLEDDLADFVAYLRREHDGPIVLVGHSSGGGFVIRIAGSTINHLFNRYVLLAPYLKYDAPINRGTDGGGWAKPKTYSFRLWENFGSGPDYLGPLSRTNAPVVVLDGTADEIFYADKYAMALEPVKRQVSIELIPRVNHMGMVSDPAALARIVKVCALSR